MTELGLGGAFNNYFLRFPMDNKRLAPKEPAMTLQEFFDANRQFIADPTERLICNKDNGGFTVQSPSFQRLKSLLILKGFTTDDWIMLADKPSKPKSGVKQGNLFPFSFDKKSELMKQPFISLRLVKLNSETFRFFLQALPVKKVEQIMLSDVLAITREDIVEVTGTKEFWKIPYSQVQSLRIFITKLQNNLTEFGFKPEDGSFMTISFKKVERVDDGITPYMRRKLSLQRA